MIAPRLFIPLIALFGVVWVSPAPAAESRPNVILIMVDDLGYRDLGCYGHPQIRTPVIDGLAAEGMRLTDFHAGASVCTPSRMALLTGAYPVRLGWTQGVVGYKMGMKDGMSPKALTLAEVFQSEGYTTGISGKWHIGDLPATRPHNQGFDWTYYIPSSNNQTDLLRSGNEIVEQPFDNRLLTEQFTAKAAEFIRASKDGPFFLYLPYTAPHFPVEAHPDWEGHSDFGAYGDVVEELDARVGSLMELLEELEIRERTLVVFCSDNGPQKGQQASAMPLRGQKWSPLEGGTRVPCVVNWPGVIPAGRECGELVSAMDLLPTLSRACGIDWESKSRGTPPIDGLDVWDTLRGNTETHPRQELLLWHGLHSEPQAFRSGDWKLFFDRRHALENLGAEAATPGQLARLERHREKLDPDAANPPFLFKLSDDLGETEDLSAEFPEKVEALQARARTLIREIRAAESLEIVTPGNTE
jgi:arylsulfatase A-like enzyme